jgi:HAE1 family hydrophobic/amphiphilic exporter-1
MGLTRLAISRPVVILMMVAAFLVLGLLGFSRMPAELNPQVDLPRITVVTNYVGTNPQEMETLITKPIEDSIAGVSGIQQVTSYSQQGKSNVSIQFYYGTNLDTADSDVIQKVDAIRSQLPIDAGAPAVIKADTSGQPIMHIAMESDKLPVRTLQSMAQNIVEPALEQATDVGQVNIAATSQRQILVSVSPDRLVAYGITISQLADSLANANVNVASGFIQSGKQYYNVRLIGEFQTVDEIRQLRITIPGTGGGSSSSSQNGVTIGGVTTGGVATTAGGGGSTASSSSSSSSTPAQTVALSDIADVYDTGTEQTQDSYVNGKEAVGIDILKTTDGNTLAAIASVRQQLTKLEKFVPSNVKFIISFDQSETVNSNLNDVVFSLVLGSLLAILVVFIFLHNWRGTVIIAIAIPTSMIATFLPLYAGGFTLNTFTLLGLSLAVGILVDDSIVVLENINRHLALGEEPAVAAINGRSEIGYAALTLTAVDLVVFLPIAFMGGVVGQFFKSFGITVAFATLFSMFVSFTLTPMLAARWYRKGEPMEFDRGFAGWFDRRFLRVEQGYQNILRSALRHPWVVVFIGTAFVIAVFLVIGSRLGFRFAPEQDQNQITVLIEAPAGSSLAYTQRIADKISAVIKNDKQLSYDTKFINTTLGDAGSGQHETGTQYGHVDLTLYDRESPLDKIQFWKHEHLRDVADVALSQKLAKLTKNIPGALILPSNVSGFSSGAPLEIDLTGPDFNQLQTATQKVQALVAAVPGTYNVDNNYKASQPEVEVRLDRVKAPEYGLSLATVAQALADGVEGNTNTKYRDPVDGQQYDLNIQLAYPYRNNPQAISNVIVGYQNGSPIHLGDVANVSVGAAPVTLNRLNRQREIAITAYLQPGIQPGNISIALTPKVAKALEGTQVSSSFGGDTQRIQQEGGYLLTAFVLGLILSYMLMAALFNNLMYPLSIMLSVPQAWAGAFIALWIAGEPLSLIAMIGLVLLNAIVNKNAILMIDYTNTLRARGYKRIDALLEAGPIRLRPIMMTTFTVLVSSLPTALALGRGAGFRQSLGVTTIGGITLSLVLTLVVVPCAYLIFDNFTNWLGRAVLHQQIPPEALAYAGSSTDEGTRDAEGTFGGKRPSGQGVLPPDPTDAEEAEKEREPLD